jgi:hypothetical protein
MPPGKTEKNVAARAASAIALIRLQFTGDGTGDGTGDFHASGGEIPVTSRDGAPHARRPDRHGRE